MPPPARRAGGVVDAAAAPTLEQVREHRLATVKSWTGPEAIEQYRRALAVNHNDAEVHFQLALALRAIGRTAEALAEFSEARRLEAPH